MSFFQEEGDDSNLQYDDAAFMYFIASTLIVATATIFVFVLRDLLSLRISDRSTIERTGRLNKQLVNLAALKRRKVFTLRFFLKIAVIGALVGLTIGVFEQSRRAENKMKGFDPYEILGLSRSATLRDVKKAYR
jgi:preprotein translocase subunit Sec63